MSVGHNLHIVQQSHVRWTSYHVRDVHAYYCLWTDGRWPSA